MAQESSPDASRMGFFTAFAVGAILVGLIWLAAEARYNAGYSAAMDRAGHEVFMSLTVCRAVMPGKSTDCNDLERLYERLGE